jgi:hypothetical protein
MDSRQARGPLQLVAFDALPHKVMPLPAFEYHERRPGVLCTEFFRINSPALKAVMAPIVPMDWWNADTPATVNRRDLETSFDLLKCASENLPNYSPVLDELVLLLQFVRGYYVYLRGTADPLRNAITIPKPRHNPGAKRWPETFARSDAYIDHLTDPKSNPMSPASLTAEVQAVHGASDSWSTGNSCGYPDNLRDIFEDPQPMDLATIAQSVKEKHLQDTVGYHRNLLDHIRRDDHHDSLHCFCGVGGKEDSIDDATSELSRRLKRKLIQRDIRKALGQKSDHLATSLLNIDNYHHAAQAGLLYTFARDTFRIWRTGLKGIDHVLNNVSPESLWEVLGIILIADSMRSGSLSDEKHFCSTEEYAYTFRFLQQWLIHPRFVHDLHRWRTMLTPKDRPTFDMFVWAMYGTRPMDHDSPFEPTDNLRPFTELFHQIVTMSEVDIGFLQEPSEQMLAQKNLRHFQDSLHQLISEIDMPQRSSAAIPFMSEPEPDLASPVTWSSSVSSTLPQHSHLEHSSGTSYCSSEQSPIPTICPSVVIIAATVVFGVVLTCVLGQWQGFFKVRLLLTLRIAWYDCHLIPSILKPWRAQYGHVNLSWSASSARNSYILARLLRFPDHAIHGLKFDHGFPSYDSLPSWSETCQLLNTRYPPHTKLPQPSPIPPSDPSMSTSPPPTISDGCSNVVTSETSIASSNSSPPLSFSCPRCTRSFPQKFNLNKHMRTSKTCSDSATRAERYICTQCHAESTTKWNLKEHQKKYCSKKPR